ncbi:MAG TPA: 23S rRNA (uracil(1939)-C(5))-methyltransferase RlmD [Acidobacteriaceae bacterium]|nr:23S rRNA (uracil(1939)-C(5))-methyltransferase RlmD [Acidobacteriaceae bacterium]
MKLHIEKAVYGGAGLARAGGKAVFVPFTLSGETVEARVTEDRRSYSTAELEAVTEPSAARVTAPCPYFGACGGCHYQHAEYSAQVEVKTAILRETLERARVKDIPEIAAVTGEPFGYRNRVRLHVERNPFSLCYKRRNSHASLAVETCPIAAPALQRAMETLNREGGALGLGEWARQIELFVNPEESAMVAALWTEGQGEEAEGALAHLWTGLREVVPEMSGIALFAVEKERRAPRVLAKFGEDSLKYRVSGREYQVTVGSFFQVNRFLIAPLVELVTAGESGGTAWDLYAGVGLFSLPLAEKFAEVTAVEAVAGTVWDLRENLRGTKHRVVAAETAAFLRQAAERRAEAPDLVVIDPPRDGLGAAVTTLLGKIQAPRIAYVSCEPATLSRDVAALLESGYRLAQMHLVDLFPQTFHLESVAQLILG